MGEGFVRNSILSCQTKPAELSFASCFGQVFVDCMCDTKGAKKYGIVMRQTVYYFSMFVNLKQHCKNRLKSSKVSEAVPGYPSTMWNLLIHGQLSLELKGLMHIHRVC